MTARWRAFQRLLHIICVSLCCATETGLLCYVSYIFADWFSMVVFCMVIAMSLFLVANEIRDWRRQCK